MLKRDFRIYTNVIPRRGMRVYYWIEKEEEIRAKERW